MDNFDNFDNIELAQRLEKHGLLEFRRIAAHLYKRNKKWKRSMEVSKKDKIYKDAMEAAYESRDLAVVEQLLDFFITNGQKDQFALCLYICYDLLHPDVVLEKAWKHGLNEFAMPFFIQVAKEMNSKMEKLEKDIEKLHKEGKDLHNG